MSCRSCARGATLIEVLIAVLVLAVGILGLMGLQINGKRTNYAALQRSAAVSLAQDMINRMRANSNVALTGTFLDANYDTGSYTGGRSRRRHDHHDAEGLCRRRCGPLSHTACRL